MAYATWAKQEDKTRRSLVTTKGAMKFQTRYYNIASKVAESELPTVGTLMHDEADTLTSWRVYEDQTTTLRTKGERPVVLQYYKLEGTIAGDILTLEGVRRNRREGSTEYTTVVAAKLQASLPALGDAYSGDASAEAVDIGDSEERWPGLYGATVVFYNGAAESGNWGTPGSIAWTEIESLYRLEQRNQIIVHHRFYHINAATADDKTKFPAQGELIDGSAGVNGVYCRYVNLRAMKGGETHLIEIASYQHQVISEDATSANWVEEKSLYRVDRNDLMTVYHKFYPVSRAVAIEANLPAQGELLSGSGVTGEYCMRTHLRPIPGNGDNVYVEIVSYILQGTTDSIGGNTVLILKGYPKQRDLGDGTEYTLRYAATAAAHIPGFGDAYEDDSTAVTGDVVIDPDGFPGLFAGTMTFNNTRARI